MIYKETSIHDKNHFSLLMENYSAEMHSRGKAKRTVDTYTQYITNFLHYIYGNDIPWDFYKNVNAYHINKYLHHEKDKSASHRALIWTALNSLFEFLYPEYITHNPLNSVERPSTDKTSDFEYFKPDEIIAILTKALNTPDYRFKNRDVSMMMLGFFYGLTSATIININAKDLDLENHQLKIWKSDDLLYTIPLHDSVYSQLLSWYNEWLQFYRSSTNDALFITQIETRISTSQFIKTIAGHSLTPEKRLTPQIMRSSAIINMYNQTHDIKLCSEFFHFTDMAIMIKYIDAVDKGRNFSSSALIDSIYGNETMLSKCTNCELFCTSLPQPISPPPRYYTIEDLDFTVRTYNALRRADIKTVAQLLSYSYNDLLKIRNLGRRCIIEIAQKLVAIGLNVNDKLWLIAHSDDPEEASKRLFYIE